MNNTKRSSNAARPHVVGNLVTLRRPDGSPVPYVWLTDRSRYPGAKVKELAKRLPRRQRALLTPM